LLRCCTNRSNQRLIAFECAITCVRYATVLFCQDFGRYDIASAAGDTNTCL
jgi:hypothetical protein